MFFLIRLIISGINTHLRLGLQSSDAPEKTFNESRQYASFDSDLNKNYRVCDKYDFCLLELQQYSSLYSYSKKKNYLVMCFNDFFCLKSKIKKIKKSLAKNIYGWDFRYNKHNIKNYDTWQKWSVYFRTHLKINVLVSFAFHSIYIWTSSLLVLFLVNHNLD